MDKQMERLYAAAEKLKGIKGQSRLARLLNASPQTVKNWESRGISKQGMLEAQRAIGCSALWIETGEGDMIFNQPARTHDPQPHNRQSDYYDENIAAIIYMLFKLDKEGRIRLRGKIEAWIEEVMGKNTSEQSERRDLSNFDRRNGTK